MRPVLYFALCAMIWVSAGSAQETDNTPAVLPNSTGSVVEATSQSAQPMIPRDAADLMLEEFQWIARPIIVFADTPADPRFIEQMELLEARPAPLLERDVVVIVDTDPAARSAIRTALRPRGFALVIMQKDGNVGVRRPSPRNVREIVRTIDNFSLRQEEIRNGS